MLYRVGLLVMFLLATLIFFCGGAAAQQNPPALWEPRTFSVGLGAGYEAVYREDGSQKSGPTAIAYLARPLNEFALVARASWNFTDGSLRVSPGIHYRFPVLGEHFAAALSYDLYAVNDVPSPANEWAVGVAWSRLVGRALVLGASASYGLDTHDFRPVAQLTLPLHTARN